MGVFAKFLNRQATGRAVPPRSPWDAKFPDIAVDNERSLSGDGDLGEVAWAAAPETSHVQAFKYQDARQSRFVREFLKGGPSAGRSILSVRFKPTRTQSAKHYEYYFDDAAKGELVYQLLTEAEHPGEIVHHYLIGWGIPYRRLS